MASKSYIVEDHEKNIFLLDRIAYVSEEIHEKEMEKIFSKCWIYVGHSSEIKNPGDFQSRYVAGRPVIFCRNKAGEIKCYFNTCRHRGAVVCVERSGNKRNFRCVYHSWAYDLNGKLVGLPGEEAYSGEFNRDELSLRSPVRFDSYKDFWFLSLEPDVPSLEDYLAGAKEYIDLVVDQSPSGNMEIISGTQEYDIASNWKLMVENSVDDYHLPSTHSTWLKYMMNSGVKIEKPKDGMVLPKSGKAIALGNGHLTTDNLNYRGRPVAAWIPMYGEKAKTQMAAIRQELEGRLGPERAERVANTNRNLVIFPNLVINDGSSVTVRTFYPNGAGNMHVRAWALGTVEEDQDARARRLDAFLTFYGPGGFATPDDVEALEMVQQGLKNWREDRWSEMSRGMGKPDEEQLNSDEHHLRTFWRRWNELMKDA